jgi:hypothetical protein
METRAEKIRRLQGLITLEEAQKAIFVKYDLYSPARQALLDGLKNQLEYEQKMELEEIKRPVVSPPPQKSWQENIGRYILIGVIIAVVAGLAIFFIVHYLLLAKYYLPSR